MCQVMKKREKGEKNNASIFCCRNYLLHFGHRLYGDEKVWFMRKYLAYTAFLVLLAYYFNREDVGT